MKYFFAGVLMLCGSAGSATVFSDQGLARINLTYDVTRRSATDCARGISDCDTDPRLRREDFVGRRTGMIIFSNSPWRSRLPDYYQGFGLDENPSINYDESLNIVSAKIIDERVDLTEFYLFQSMGIGDEAQMLSQLFGSLDWALPTLAASVDSNGLINVNIDFDGLGRTKIKDGVVEEMFTTTINNFAPVLFADNLSYTVEPYSIALPADPDASPQPTPAPVPLPATIWMAAAGLAALGGLRAMARPSRATRHNLPYQDCV